MALTVSRRRLLTATAALGVLPSLPAAAKAPSLPFVLIGDWGRQGNWQQREVGRQMGATATEIASRFTISVGDNFYEDGVTSLDDPQWQDSFETIYPAPSLRSPWHVILGNHDYRGNVQAQLDYATRDNRWTMPARYYQRRETLSDGTPVDLFFIDTSPFLSIYRHTKVNIDGQDTDAQLVWLDRALGSSTAAWKIVIGHHPLYTVTGGKRNQPELIGPIKPLLAKHNVRVYINGHDHNLQDLVVDGVHYITNGAGSQTESTRPAAPGQFSSDSHGFMTAELTADHFVFAFIDDSGTRLYQSEVARI